jgi:integrase/recombinase XerD
MKRLRKAADDYFELRRGLGFKVERQQTRVRQFLVFLQKERTTRITTELAIQFATLSPELAPKTQSSRLGAVRDFARYYSTLDPMTEVPPPGLLPSGSRRARPYLYAQSEIRKILKAAKNHPSPHPFQAWTYYCIIGLLSVTGMRVGEVLNLRDRDIDWPRGCLTIPHAKFGKSRLIPLHRSTLRVLASYLQQRNRFFAQQAHRPVCRFFVTSHGTPLLHRNLTRVFHGILKQIGLRAPGERRGPRLHDFRHRFAVETLLRWYRRGEPADCRLPVLATYLGHTHVSSTYWYLSCSPELMAAAGRRVEKRWRGIR